MIRFACPKCDTSLKTADEKAGTKLLCPDCGEKVTVPAASAEKKGGGSTKTATLPKKTAAKTSPGGSSKSTFIGLAVGACVLVAAGAGFAIWKMNDKPKQELQNYTSTGITPAKPMAPPDMPPASSAAPAAALPALPPSAPAALPPVSVAQAPASTPDSSGTNLPPSKSASANPGAAQDSDKRDANLPSLVSLEGEAAYSRLLKAACWIVVETKDGSGSGSGALIDRENRLVLTAHHVIDGAENGQGKIWVLFPFEEKGRLVAEKSRYQKLVDRKEAIAAHIEWSAQKKDLALLKLAEIPEGIQPLRLGAKSVVPGQRIHSIGSPGASSGVFVYSPGSARQVYHDDWVAGGGGKAEPSRYSARVVDAASPTNPGDSGGPMVNEQKELMGIVHGGKPGANLMARFIDIEDIRDMFTGYVKSKGLKRSILDDAPRAERNDEVPVLVKMLENRDPSSRSKAAEVLGRIGVDAKPAIGPLLALLKDKDDDVRIRAAEALEQIGGLSQRHLTQLGEGLKDPNPDVRLAVIAAIKIMGSEAESTAGTLCEILKNDKTPVVRQKAAAAIGSVGAQGKTAVPALAEALKDESSGVRRDAAGALAKLGASAAPAVKELAEALKDNQQEVRVNALTALEAIGSDAKVVLPQIQKALKERDKETRLAAVSAVAGIRAEDKETVKCLVDLLEEKDYRKDVNDALVRIGKGTVPTLNLELNNPKAQVRLGVVQALEQLGADARPALNNLVRLGQVDADAEVRVAAAKAAMTIQKKVTGRP